MKSFRKVLLEKNSMTFKYQQVTCTLKVATNDRIERYLVFSSWYDKVFSLCYTIKLHCLQLNIKWPLNG